MPSSNDEEMRKKQRPEIACEPKGHGGEIVEGLGVSAGGQGN